MLIHTANKKFLKRRGFTSLPVRLILAGCFLVFPLFTFSQTTWTAGGDGVNWSSAGNWSTGIVPNNAAEDVTITGGYTGIIMNGNYTIRNLIIGNGNNNNTITVSGTNTLTIAGTLRLNNTDAVRNDILDVADGTVTIAGVATFGTAGQSSIKVDAGTVTFSSAVTLNDADQDITFTNAGTVNFNAGLSDNGYLVTFAGCTVNFGGSYTNDVNDMTWNATSTANFTCAGCNITSNNSGGGSDDVAFGHLQVAANATVTIVDGSGGLSVAGNLTLNSSSKLTMNEVSGLNVTGDVTLNASSNLTLGANLQVSTGSWTNNGGTLSAGTNSVTFGDDGGARTGTIGGTSGTAFYDLIVNDDAVYTLAGALTYTVTNNFTFTAGNAVSSLTHDGSNPTLLVSGNATINQPTGAATKSWNINGGTGTVTGAFSFTGTSANTSRIAQVAVTSGSLTITGAVNWMAQPATTGVVVTEVITVSTGTVTFGSSLSMPDGSGTLSVTGTGTINFNGTSAPSFDFFNGAAAADVDPVFTTTSGCTLNFARGFTNSNVALTIAAGSLSVFTGNASSTITSNAAITFGHFKIDATVAAVTLAGADISVKNDWTSLGGTLSGSFAVIFNGTGIQTINITGAQTFYNLTTFTTGPLTLASNVTVTNLLTMTTGNIDLSTYTLQLGNAAASTLTRAAGIMYNGTGGAFKRYWPAVAITSGSGNYYGLFPMGTSTDYRPLTINEATGLGTAGYLSVSHTNAYTTTDVSVAGNPGTVTRITDQSFTITNSGIGGTGVYDLDATFTTFSTAGLLSDLRLVTPSGATGSGTHQVATGSISNPIGHRATAGLNITDLANTWVIGTVDIAVTPLRQKYYSMTSTNWSDATAGNWSYTSAAGPTCSCSPSEITEGYVYIGVGHTVTVDVPSTCAFIDILNTATLTGASNLTVTYDMSTAGSGKFTPTAGTWAIGRNLTMVGTGSSSLAGTSTVTGILNIGAGTILTMSGGVGLTTTGNLLVDGTLALGTSTLTLNGVSGTTISGSAGAAIITGAAATISVTTANKTIPAGANLTIDPAFAITGAITVTNNATVTLTGNLTGSAGGSTWINASGSTLNVAGTVLTTGVLTASVTANTVNYNGAGAQTIKDPATSYYNLTCSNAGTKSLAGDVAVTNLVTISGSAVLDESAAGNDLTGAAGLTMTGTSGLIVIHTASTTFPQISGTYSLGSTTTVTITGSAGGAGNIVRSATYGNLHLNGTSKYDLSAVSAITNNLYISNTADLDANAAITVGGAFYYTSSATSTLTNNLTASTFTMTAGTIQDAGYAITINGGGWTKDGGTFTATGTAAFTGTAAQTISGTSSTSFNNLTIFNTSTTGVTLAQPIIVLGTGALALTDGYLYTDAVNLLTLNDNATSGSGSAASFVDGPMKKIGNEAFVFPTGDDVAPAGAGAEDVWARIGVAAQASATQQFTATYFFADYADPTMDVTLLRIGLEYWTLDRAVTANDVNVTLYWEDWNRSYIHDNSSADLVVARYNGADWTSNGQSWISGTSPGSVTSTSVSSYNTAFTFGSLGGTNPLPVELLSFDAQPNDNIVDVTWTTASEFNNAYFEVQRSRDGNTFEEVGKVNSNKGNSTTPENYSAVDHEPYDGVSYYRLKQVDNDGKNTFSSIVAVKFEDKGAIEIYPNPASKSEPINISISGKNEKEVLIVVRDLQGKEFYSKVVIILSNQEVFAIDCEGKLASGMYFIVASSDNSIYEKKVVIK